MLKERTVKLRRNLAYKILKILTPRISKDLKKYIYLKENNSINKTPRPSFEIMKVYFNNLELTGVEIGVGKGYNAISILKVLNIKKLYLIDTWSNYKGIEVNFLQEINYSLVVKEFKNNKKIEIIKDFSDNVINQFLDNSLDFVYIDGNHSFNFVLSDITKWYPKVKVNGFLCGHDVFNCIDVCNALKVFCLKNNISFFVKFPDWYIFKESVLVNNNV